MPSTDFRLKRFNPATDECIKLIYGKCHEAEDISALLIAIPVNIEREYITRWGVVRGENRDSSL